jgi:hypothetical protein
MHQLDGWSITGNKNSILTEATAFKNATDLAAEYRNTAIARANKIAAQTVDEEEEDTEGEGENDNSEDNEDIDD